MWGLPLRLTFAMASLILSHIKGILNIDGILKEVMPQERVRFKCLRCGRCCSDASTVVTVTATDIARIANFLGLTEDELLSVLGFYQLGEETPADQVDKMVTKPIMTERGSAFVGLLKGEGGRCVYLNEENECSIYPARPTVCRTFPFTFTAVKRIKGGVDYTIKIGITSKGREYCPGLNASGAPLIKLVEWKKVGAEALQEMVNHADLAENWNQEVQNNPAGGTARDFVAYVLSSQAKPAKTREKKIAK